jgi:penicillin-insensitive murein endopeptidase
VTRYAAVLALFAIGCTHTPTPLHPAIGGSLGTTSRGMLTNGAEIQKSASLKWLRGNDRHWGLPRFTQAIERAAARVAEARPQSVLLVGDLSVRTGGPLSPHFSHRNGRDADLLLYLTTLDGAPVESPGFIHFDTDGLAWDGKRYLRFDVEREWLLVKALLEDPEARIQWIFVSEVIQAILVEHARARGDDPDTIARALEVMLQPNPGGIHDDHLHVRTACTPLEVSLGCENMGPQRSFFAPHTAILESDDDLVVAILRPLTSKPLAAQ